jgi:formylglycine-generating enzyme required for sulfatase activity/serine/threonine protein kinase
MAHDSIGDPRTVQPSGGSHPPEPASTPSQDLQGHSIGDAQTQLPRGGGRPREVLAPGAVIDERYEVLALLGRGGMGEVYACRDRKLARDVAVKRLLSGHDVTPVALQRFRREANAIAQLSHPNIVTLFEFGDDAGGPYFAMERLAGSDLHAYVKEHGALRPSEVLRVGREICKALAYAHSRGLVHRDLKPSNLFRLPDGSIKVLDFGLVREQEGSGMSQVGIGMGTANYAAPEQREDASKADARSDIYSVGATLYYLAMAKSPTLIRESELPKVLRPILMELMAERPTDRPATILKVQEMLAAPAGLDAADDAADAASSPDKVTCKKCKFVNSNQALYCGQCTQPLHVHKLCLHCDKPVRGTDARCVSCGKDLKPQHAYYQLLEEAEDAVNARRISEADALLTKAVAYKFKDQVAQKRKDNVRRILEDGIRIADKIREAAEKEDLSTVRRELAGLEAKFQANDPVMVQGQKAHDDLERKLDDRRKRIEGFESVAHEANKNRLWNEAKRQLELAQKEQHTPARASEIKRLDAQLGEIARLEEEIPRRANALEIAELESAVSRYEGLVPLSSPKLQTYKQELLPKTKSRHADLTKACAEFIASAEGHEANRDWVSARLKWQSARGTGFAQKQTEAGMERVSKTLRLLETTEVQAQDAYSACALEPLEEAAKVLDELLPAADPRRLHVRDKLLAKALERNARADDLVRNADALMVNGDWEQALVLTQQALTEWRTHAYARATHATATERIKEWTDAVESAEKALRSGSIAHSAVAVQACKAIRPLHPQVRTLQAGVQKLKARRKLRNIAAAISVLVMLVAWSWFAGFQYSSQLAQRELKAIHAADAAAEAVLGLDLVRAVGLVDELDALAFDESTALLRVQQMHADSSVAWLPQPVFMARWGLAGLQRPELVEQAKALRDDLVVKQTRYREVLDRIYLALAEERFVDAERVTGTLPMFGRDDPRNNLIPLVVAKLRSLSAELVGQDQEARQRLDRADLLGAERALTNHRQLMAEWDAAMPKDYGGTSPWPRVPARHTPSVAEARQRVGEIVRKYEDASKSFNDLGVERGIADLRDIQADDPRLTEWEAMLAALKAAQLQADRVCAELQTALSAGDMQTSIAVYDALDERTRTLFDRSCVAERQFKTKRLQYTSALGEFDTAIARWDTKTAANALERAAALQKFGSAIDSRRKQLDEFIQSVRMEQEWLEALSAALAARDLDKALSTWDGAPPNWCASERAQALRPRLDTAREDLQRAEAALETAIQAANYKDVREALQRLEVLQAPGPRITLAKEKIARLMSDRDREVQTAVDAVIAACAARNESQADAALLRLRQVLVADRTASYTDELELAQRKVDELKTANRLIRLEKQGRDLLAASNPDSEEVQYVINELAAAGGAPDLLASLRAKPSPKKSLSWAIVERPEPDPKVVTNSHIRNAIRDTNLPWKVRDKVTGIEMVLIPPGEYQRGASPEDTDADVNERPAHSVVIKKAFYMGVYEVTQAEWLKMMGSNPSYFDGARLPVETVSWNDTKQFLQESGGLRLPTEGEWEYACRAATTGAHYGELPAVAWYDENTWYDENSGNRTMSVGGKQANGYGLHDMLGNVFEWCADWYEKYKASPQSDPTGPSSGEVRICRGGSWLSFVRYCRASARFELAPTVRYNNLGFRVARNP